MSSTSSSLVALPPEVPSSSSSFSSSPSFSTLESLALENFYQNYNHQDDPFKGRWECLYAGVDCNTVAFDWRGAYLAIGTADGHIHIWSITPIQRRIGTLSLPVYTLTQLPSSSSSSVSASFSSPSPPSTDYYPPPHTPLNRSILTIAWSVTGRLLYVSTVSGYIVVIDTENLTIVRTILSPDYVNFIPRFIKAHPFPYAPYHTLLLVIPWYGMPMLLDWYHGRWLPFSQALLPPPAATRIRASLAQKGTLPLQTDACWDTSKHTDGKSIYLITTRGTMVQLRVSFLENNAVNQYNDNILTLTTLHYNSHDSNKNHSLSLSSSSSPSYVIYRMNYAHTAIVIAPPEIHSSRSHPFITVTTTRGIHLYDNVSLAPIDLKYSEPVDNTKLISTRLSMDDKYIYALPHAHSGHMSGGVYAFRRGRVGDIRLKRGPRGGVRCLDCHPTRGILVGITSRGAVYLLRQSFFTHWPGPMYPPGFTLFLQNREYTEAEDEYDLILENGKFTFRPVKVPDSLQPINTVNKVPTKGEGINNYQYTQHYAQLQQVMHSPSMVEEEKNSIQVSSSHNNAITDTIMNTSSTAVFPLNYLSHSKHVHDILESMNLARDQNLIAQHILRATEQECERKRYQAQQQQQQQLTVSNNSNENTATGTNDIEGVEEEEDGTISTTVKKSGNTGSNKRKNNSKTLPNNVAMTVEDTTITSTSTPTNGLTTETNLLQDQPVALGLESINQSVIFNGEPLLIATILQSNNPISNGTETIPHPNENVLNTWNLFLQDWRITMGISKTNPLTDIFTSSTDKDSTMIEDTGRKTNVVTGPILPTLCTPVPCCTLSTVPSLAPSSNILSSEFLYHLPTHIDPPSHQEQEERLYRDQRRLYSQVLHTILFTSSEESKENIHNEDTNTHNNSITKLSTSPLESLIIPAQLVETIRSYDLPYIDNTVLRNNNLHEKVTQQVHEGCTPQQEDDPVQQAINKHNSVTSKRAQMCADLTKAVTARKRQAEAVALRTQQQQQKLREQMIQRQKFLQQQQQQQQQQYLQQQQFLQQQQQQFQMQNNLYNTGNSMNTSSMNHALGSYVEDRHVHGDEEQNMNTNNNTYPTILSPHHTGTSVSPNHVYDPSMLPHPHVSSSLSSSLSYERGSHDISGHPNESSSLSSNTTTVTPLSPFLNTHLHYSMQHNHPNTTGSTNPETMHSNSNNNDAMMNSFYSHSTTNNGTTDEPLVTTLVSSSVSPLSVDYPHLPTGGNHHNLYQYSNPGKRKVTDEMRALIVEYRLAGMPRKEVASMFGVSVTTVGDVYRAARGYRNQRRNLNSHNSFLNPANNGMTNTSENPNINSSSTGNENYDDEDDEDDED